MIVCSLDERKVECTMLYVCACIGNRAKTMNIEVEEDISPPPKYIMMRVQCIPKANSTFVLACGGRLIVVEGRDLRNREF